MKEKRRPGLLQMKPTSKMTTFKLGNDFVTKRLIEVYERLQNSEEIYRGVPRLFYFSIPLTMDMEYAHIDGYFGIKVYNALYDEARKEVVNYWSPETQRPP